jgi:molybdopterin-guanine dinucleotide biosynthesis protein B
MKLIHIVGCKNDGKTTLIIELIKELNRRGLKVGTVKHGSHTSPFDTPGKDSYRHKEAGSDPAAIVTQFHAAVFFSPKKGTNIYQQLASLFKDVDVVLVEGDKNGPGKKVEVWRKKIRLTPLCFARNDIMAVITDDAVDKDFPIPVWPRSDMVNIADHICLLAEICA